MFKDWQINLQIFTSLFFRMVRILQRKTNRSLIPQKVMKLAVKEVLRAASLQYYLKSSMLNISKFALPKIYTGLQLCHGCFLNTCKLYYLLMLNSFKFFIW